VELTRLVEAGGHEQLVAFAESSVGLRGYVAIHSTALGPALGGIRFWHYEREADAVADVLRLSAAMTTKAAVAGLHQGGGKAVVLWDDPHRERDDELRAALGQAIHLLAGRYVAAEDVGATQADMDGIARVTPWVTGIDPAHGGSGDPSPVTAWGVLHGMHAVCAEVFGDRELGGRRVVVLGVGKVGAALARLLVERDVEVVVADVDTDRAAHVAAELDVDVVPPQHAIEAPCDVLSPCALGGVIDVSNVGRLRCRAVCGGANNQLVDGRADLALAEAGIVYAPDFVVNAGGIVNIANEWAPGGYVRERALREVARIEETTHRVLALARAEGVPPGRAGELIARGRIEAAGAGKRYVPGEPSVMRDALLARWERFTGSASAPTSPPPPSP
jgi:glutamate dehydrogenase/leucine dehydrogenase